MAWQTAHLLNVHVSKGPPITVRKLLGPEFFEGDPEAQEFKTKEEWEAHKADVRKNAAWHAKVLRDLREGRKEGKKVIHFKDVKTRDQ